MNSTEPLSKHIQARVKEAMRAKDKLMLDTLRGLLAAIQYAAMEKKVDSLSSEQELTVIQGELKKLNESLAFAEQGKREDLANDCKARIEIVQLFTPKQLNRTELEHIIRDYRNSNGDTSMGTIMQYMKTNFGGQFDGKLASEVIKESLNN